MARIAANNRIMVRDMRASLLFNGSDAAFVDLASKINNIGNAFTVSVLINLKERNEKIIIGNRTDTGVTGFYFKTRSTSGTVRLGVGDGSIYGVYDSASQFIKNSDLGKWIWLTAVYNAGTITFYNGIVPASGPLVSGNAITGNIADSPTYVPRIGAYVGAGTAYKINANLREVRFWKKALSLTEITNLIYQNIVPVSNLSLELKMDEGTGSSVADSSGNANNGTITAAVWSTNTPLKARTNISVARTIIDSDKQIISSASLTGWTLDTNGIGTKSIEDGAIKYIRTVDKTRNWTSTLRYTLASALPWVKYDERVLVFEYMWDIDINSLSVSFVNSAGSAIAGTTPTVITDSAKDIWHTARIPMFGSNLSNIKYFHINHGGDRYASWNNGDTSTLRIKNIRMETIRRKLIPDNPTPVVAFQFDDGYLDVHTNALPIFQKYGMVATVNMITNKIGGQLLGVDMLGESQLAALVAAGWELASHTKDHVNMASANAATIIDQMSGSKAALEALGYTVKHFSYPFTIWDEEAVAISKLYYESAGVGTPPTQNEMQNKTSIYGKTDVYKLVRTSVGLTKTVSEIIRAIKDARDYHNLLIIYAHDVNDLGDNDAWTAAQFDELLGWMKANGIGTMRTTDAIAHYHLV